MSDDLLLADLVSSFPGNTEDIATEALCHIFRHSAAGRKALNDVVKSGVRGVNPINSVKTQVIGLDGTRPDLVCCDQTGQERVLIEVKFWAPLTANQPNGYVKNRLPKDGPAVLMFLVPHDRIPYLWPQLTKRVRELDPVKVIDAERRCVRIGDTQQHLMVVSWESLLDSMAARSSDSGEHSTTSQIRQLRSLAQHAGDQGPKPIPSGTEPDTSETRLSQYRRLVDAATEEGLKQGWADRKGLHRARQSYGYGRYISLCGNVVWFGINKELFETSGTTPLWVGRHQSHADEPDVVNRELGDEDRDWHSLHGRHWFPIELKRDVEEPQILAGVVDSLKRYGDALEEARKAAEHRASGSTDSS